MVQEQEDYDDGNRKLGNEMLGEDMLLHQGLYRALLVRRSSVIVGHEDPDRAYHRVVDNLDVEEALP